LSAAAHPWLLKLLQLADSALPIGAAAHSYGLETLAAHGVVDENNLDGFLRSFLEENGTLELAFLRVAHRMDYDAARWIELNTLLSARKPAREPRTASVTLGRRLLLLGQELEPSEILQSARATAADTHLATAFGLVAKLFGIPEEPAALAFLQQSLTSLVSACQRMMPLGQTAASRMVWNLRPAVVRIARESAEIEPAKASSFAPLAEIGGMRHPGLETRLFVS
jgi:urease accessory protein